MTFLYFLISLLVSGPSPSPAPPATTLECATDHLHATQMKADSTYAAETVRMEAAWGAAAGARNVEEKAGLPPPFVLPIVFHIIHENGAENIPDADVLRSVDYLNQALANTDYYDQGTGTSTQISVCMARRTPDNQATGGITRTVSPLTNLETSDDREMKDLARWNPREYVNVYVVKEICGLGLGCGVAGYAYYPSAHGRDIDGIVVEARWLAGNEAGVSVLVHELGHYLGLRHTFDGGCNNDDCVRDGDRVCDTPPDQSTVAVPCGGSANTCSTDTNSGSFTTDQDDMTINYMDYNYFRCYSAFTPGQRERMHFFLDGRRHSLLESLGCQDPCPAVVTAGFTGGDVTVDVGTTITFGNTSVNGDSYVWREFSTVFSTAATASRAFDTVGIYRITLRADPADAVLCQADSVDQLITVVCPVVASFDFPPGEITEGDNLVFSSTATGATAQSWRVNDSEEGTDPNLTYPFPTSGFYEICLTAGNGLCENIVCQTVYVRALPCTGPDCENNCEAPFTAEYEFTGNRSDSSTFSCIIPVPGGHIAGGFTNDLPLLMRLDEIGEIVWQRQLFVEGTGATIKSLTLGPDGQVAGVGHLRLGENSGGFHFSFDVVTGAERYVYQPFDQSEDFRTTHIFYPRAGGDYLVLGHLRSGSGTNQGFVPAVFNFDPATGALTRPVRTSGGEETLYQVSDAAIDPATGTIYLTGTVGFFSSGAFIQSLSPQGDVIWTRKITYPGSNTGGGFKIEIDDQHLVLSDLHNTNLTGDKSLVLIKTDLQGNMPTATRIGFSDFTPFPAEIIVNETGYLLIAQSGLTHLFVQTDETGNALWARSTTNLVVQQSIGYHYQWYQQGDDLFIAAAVRGTVTGGSLQRPAVVKLRATALDLTGCPVFTPVDVSTNTWTVRTSDLPVTVTESTLDGFEVGSGDVAFALSPNSCVADCPDDNPTNPDCIDLAELNYSRPNNNGPSRFNAVIPYDGGYLVAGNSFSRAFIASMAGDGSIRWQHTTSETLFNVISNFRLDAEGMVIGSGIQNSPSGDGLNFVFRLDPLTGNFLWSKRVALGSNAISTFIDILQPTPGAEIQLVGNEFDITTGNLNAMITYLDPTDGTPGNIPVKRLSQPGNSLTLLRSTYNDNPGIIYSAGTQTDLTSITSKPYLLAKNRNGNILWGQRINPTSGANGEDYYVSDLDVVRDTLVLFGYSETPAQERYGIIFRFNTDGDPIDQWRIATPGNNWTSQSLEVTNDGYLLHSIANNTSNFTAQDQLTKLDASGAVVWSKRYDGSFGVYNYNNLATVPGGIVLSSGRNNGVYTLRKLDENGSGPDCTTSESLEVEISRTTFDLTRFEYTVLSPGFNVEDQDWENIDLTRLDGCLQECEPPAEVCDNDIDDDEDGLTDCDDPDLAGTCCCLDGPAVDLGPDTLICPGFQLGIAADGTLTEYLWSDGSTNDSLMITVAGTYWLQVTDSCGRIAADTITLNLRPRLLLDLGPDTVVCQNGVVTLTAPAGFARYQWSDASDERRFTSFGEGTFWLTATDSCGRTQTDSLRVRFDVNTEIDLGPDREICPGDVVQFRVPGYTNYQWTASSFIDCTNCEEVNFAPTMDTLLLVAAESGPGCVSSDSVRIRVQPENGQLRESVLCPGDSIEFNDVFIRTAGRYFTTSNNANCPIIDTLDVVLLRDTFIVEEVTICAGDSLLIFGEYQQNADIYRATFPYFLTGCDSTVEVRLTVFPVGNTGETIAICGGDSALVFGQFEYTAGTYTRNFPSLITACDSLHTITLEVNELIISTIATSADCGGAAAGAGEVTFGSSAIITDIRWSNGQTTTSIDGLTAGVYGVTATDGNGCEATAELTIASDNPIELTYNVQSESCPNNGDGSLTISGTDSGMTFQLNGGPTQTSPNFNNLPPDNYALLVTRPGGCDQSFNFTIDQATEFTFELPADQTIRFGDSVVIVPITNLPIGGTINWLVEPGDSCQNCPTLTLYPELTTVVSAIAGEASGCPITDQMTITVERRNPFYVPTAFSPNGDGVNDVFRVYAGPAVDRIAALRIFDRWGNLVFQAENVFPDDELAAWNGERNNGQASAIGVYVYTLQVVLMDESVVTASGEVMVMR